MFYDMQSILNDIPVRTRHIKCVSDVVYEVATVEDSVLLGEINLACADARALIERTVYAVVNNDCVDAEGCLVACLGVYDIAGLNIAEPLL